MQRLDRHAGTVDDDRAARAANDELFLRVQRVFDRATEDRFLGFQIVFLADLHLHRLADRCCHDVAHDRVLGEADLLGPRQSDRVGAEFLDHGIQYTRAAQQRSDLSRQRRRLPALRNTLTAAMISALRKPGISRKRLYLDRQFLASRDMAAHSRDRIQPCFLAGFSELLSARLQQWLKHAEQSCTATANRHVLVAAHPLDGVVADHQAGILGDIVDPVGPDIGTGIVQHLCRHILLGMEEHVFDACLIFEADLVEAVALMGVRAPDGLGLVLGQRIGGVGH